MISKLIRRLDGGHYNHVYWRFDYAPEGSQLYESHMKGGVQITPYEGLLSAKMHGKVTAIKEFDLGISPEECEELYNACVCEHGDPYNVSQIIRYYFWIRLSKRQLDKWVNKISGKYTCNQLTIKTGKRVLPEMEGLDYTYTIKPLYEMAEKLFTPREQSNN